MDFRMSQIHTSHEFSSPESQVLADIYGISADLHCSTWCLKQLRQAEASNNDFLKKTLLFGFLTTYRRCFNSGVRQSITNDDLRSLPDDAIDVHNYLIELTNRFAAHSVNRFEETKVFVKVENNKVIGVGGTTYMLATLGRNIEPSVQLIELILNNILKPRLESGVAAVVEAANEFSIEEITKRRPPAIDPAAAIEVGRRRN